LDPAKVLSVFKQSTSVVALIADVIVTIMLKGKKNFSQLSNHLTRYKRLW